jgi:hypothetical protein
MPRSTAKAEAVIAGDIDTSMALSMKGNAGSHHRGRCPIADGVMWGERK